jgi:hypothetical protein
MEGVGQNGYSNETTKRWDVPHLFGVILLDGTQPLSGSSIPYRMDSLACIVTTGPEGPNAD